LKEIHLTNLSFLPANQNAGFYDLALLSFRFITHGASTRCCCSGTDRNSSTFGFGSAQPPGEINNFQPINFQPTAIILFGTINAFYFQTKMFIIKFLLVFSDM